MIHYFCPERLNLMSNHFLLFLAIFIFGSCSTNSSKSDEKNTVNQQPQNEEQSPINNKVEEFKDRDVWQHPEYIINLLGDSANKTIADLGAGSGYFSFKLLSNAKKVIAIDIDQRFIKYMNQKISDYPAELRSKFEARLATPEDSKLTNDEVQAILIVNTYIYIKDRPKYFTQLKKCLTDRGKLVIVDFKNMDLPVGPPNSIKLSGNQVAQELKEAGYTNVTLDNNTLEYQYIILAENIK